MKNCFQLFDMSDMLAYVIYRLPNSPSTKINNFWISRWSGSVCVTETSHLDFAKFSMSQADLIIIVTPLQTFTLNVGKTSPHESN